MNIECFSFIKEWILLHKLNINLIVIYNNKNKCHNVCIYAWFLCSLSRRGLISVSIRTPKVKHQWPRSALGRIMPLSWPPKWLRVWSGEVLLVCPTSKCSSCLGVGGLPNQGSHLLHGESKLWWHISGALTRWLTIQSTPTHWKTLIFTINGWAEDIYIQKYF